MSADLADLTVGTRVRYEVGGLPGTGTVVALYPGLTFSVSVHSDNGWPAREFRPQDLTILPAEDVPPSDDAGIQTEGRVERSTEDAPSAPRPSVTIALTPEQERHLRDAPLDRLREGVAIALTPEQSILAHVQLVAADARAALDEVTR